MSIKLGNKEITEIWLYDKQIMEGYLGNTQVFFAQRYTDIVKKTSDYGSIGEGRGFMAKGVIGEFAIYSGGKNYSGYSRYTNMLREDYTYPGSIDWLAIGRGYCSGATIGNRFIVGPGETDTAGNTTNVADTYTATSLSRSSITGFSVSNKRYASAVLNNTYALFGGGVSQSGGVATDVSVVNAYDALMVRSTPISLSIGRNNLGATSFGDYVIFASGVQSSGTEINTVDIIDKDLVRSVSALPQTAQHLAGCSNKSHAVMVDTYTSRFAVFWDKNFVMSTGTVISTYFQSISNMVCLYDYLIFCKSHKVNYTRKNHIYFYDTRLTLHKASYEETSYCGQEISVAALGETILFGGGLAAESTSYNSIIWSAILQ